MVMKQTTDKSWPLMARRIKYPKKKKVTRLLGVKSCLRVVLQPQFASGLCEYFAGFRKNWYLPTAEIKLTLLATIPRTDFRHWLHHYYDDLFHAFVAPIVPFRMTLRVTTCLFQA